MLKTIILLGGILFFGATSTTVSAQGKQIKSEASKTDYKFLDDISIDPAVVEAAPVSKPVAVPAVKKDLLNAAKKCRGKC